MALNFALGLINLPAVAADMGGVTELCPPHLTEAGKFHMLQDMKIYDGPPESGAEILPRVTGKVSSWNIAASRAAGAEPNVVCTYKHTDQTAAPALPANAAECSFNAIYPAQTTCR